MMTDLFGGTDVDISPFSMFCKVKGKDYINWQDSFTKKDFFKTYVYVRLHI